MEQKKSYRIELLNTFTKQQRLYGCFYTTLEQIQKVMEGNIIGHPQVLIYTKTGKKILKEFRG